MGKRITFSKTTEVTRTESYQEDIIIEFLKGNPDIEYHGLPNWIIINNIKIQIPDDFKLLHLEKINEKGETISCFM